MVSLASGEVVGGKLVRKVGGKVISLVGSKVV